MKFGDGLVSLPEHIIAHEALRVAQMGQSAEIRRDVLANIGDPDNYRREMFLEDRSGASKGDILHISVCSDGTNWTWQSLHMWGLP